MDTTPSAGPLRRPHFSALPPASGLYDPRFEHDACGVSFVADIRGRRSRDIVATALGALCRLDHRGASGAEVNTGDGAGILIQVPDRFLRAVTPFPLPAEGAYGVGLAFLPAGADDADRARGEVERIASDEGLRIVGWRQVPVDDSMIGPTARSVMPGFWHCIVDDPAGASGIALDRMLFVIRKRCEHELTQPVYFPSL
jgi:glutamate synthase (NADPH/NADH) large chain